MLTAASRPIAVIATVSQTRDRFFACAQTSRRPRTCANLILNSQHLTARLRAVGEACAPKRNAVTLCLIKQLQPVYEVARE